MRVGNGPYFSRGVRDNGLTQRASPPEPSYEDEADYSQYPIMRNPDLRMPR